MRRKAGQKTCSRNVVDEKRNNSKIFWISKSGNSDFFGPGSITEARTTPETVLSGATDCIQQFSDPLWYTLRRVRCHGTKIPTNSKVRDFRKLPLYKVEVHGITLEDR